MAITPRGDFISLSMCAREFKVLMPELGDQPPPEGTFSPRDLEIAREAQADYDKYRRKIDERMMRAILGDLEKQPFLLTSPTPSFDFLGCSPQMREWLGSKASPSQLEEHWADEASRRAAFPAEALTQATCRTALDGLAAMAIGPSHGYSPTGAPKAPAAGDKRPDVECRQCKNKGHVIVKEVELDFHSQHPVAKLFCKLCGADQ